MKIRSQITCLAVVTALLSPALLGAAPAGAVTTSSRSLVAAHAQTVAECDVEAIVDTYTTDARVYFPGGTVVKGHSALTKLYSGLVKPRSEGGLCGLRTIPIHEWRSGDTTFAQFKDVAPFLAKPYYSTDVYVFEQGKIEAEMTTFDASKLVFRKSH